jgi:competence protein ComEC
MRSLPIWLCAAIATGASLGPYVALTAAIGFAATVCFVAIAIMALVRGRSRSLLVATLAGFLLNAWTLSAALDRAARSPPLAALVGHTPFVRIEGRLRADAAREGDSTRIVVAVTSVTVDRVRTAVRGDAMLSVGGRLAEEYRHHWRAGRILAMPAIVRRPARYLNYGVPDHQLAAARRGLILVGSVKSGALIRVVARGSWADEWAAELRAYVRDVVNRRIGSLDATAGAIAAAILIGDRTGLDTMLEDRLQAAGTYHVIAISGGNIAILAVTLLTLASLARLPNAASALLVALLLGLHAGVVGGGASVTRATLMAIGYLLLSVSDLRAAPLGALVSAAGGMIALAPEIVSDAGFLLTVCATGAIVVLAIRLSPAFARPRQPPMREAVSTVVAASVATEIVLLPIAAALFGRVTAAGPVLNLIAVPAMAILQQAGLVTIATDRLWPSLAAVAGHVVVAAAYALVESSRLVDWMPAVAKRVPAPGWFVIAAYFGSGAILLTALTFDRVPGLWRRRLKLAGATTMTAAAFWILLTPHVRRWPWTPDGWLTVIGIDVGQGDATLIRFPNAATMLVDTGGLGGARFDMGARVVAPAMWGLRIGWLDTLLLTHGDPDHVGGARTIIDLFRPGVFEGVAVRAHQPTEVLRTLARARGLDVRSVYRDAQWRVGQVTVRIWHPPPADWERRKVRNDDSVVIELRMGDVSIVLPGDISAVVEADLAGRIGLAPFRVLKAGHHGSGNSSSARFLDALRPSVALISCGRQNRFGHPAAAALARYRHRAVEIFRTDEDGEITVRTDGRAVEIITFSGRAWRHEPSASLPAMSLPTPRASYPGSAVRLP